MIKIPKTSILPVRQVFLIAYMTGVLWLRRNPMSLVFTAISPFSLLFVLFVISDGQYIHFAVAGSLVMALVGYGLALGQDISFYKTEYKVQDVFVASPVSPLTYMVGLALSELPIRPSSTYSASNTCCILWIGFQHTSTCSNNSFDLGSHVSAGVFSVIPYASHAKRYTSDIVCECNTGSFAPGILLHGRYAGGAAAPCLCCTDYTRIADAAIHHGPTDSRRLVT